MTDGTFDAARWTETAESLGFQVQVAVGSNGVTRLDVIVPRGIRNIKAEAELWAALRPTRLLGRYNERALCAYLKRTGRTVRSGVSNFA